MMDDIPTANLDTESTTLMDNLQVYTSTNNYNTSLAITQQNITINSSFDGVDPFYRQNAEDSSTVAEFGNAIVAVYTFPGLFLLIFGIENTFMVAAFGAMITTFLIFMIGLQTYKALRTGEVDG